MGPERSRLRTARIVAWTLVASALVAVAAFGAWRWLGPKPSIPGWQETARNLIKADFTLVDQTGKRVSDEDYRGKWLLIFFGYTHCPDVCPTTMNEISVVMDLLGDDAARVQPLMITIDPERDTPEAMKEFVGAFDPRIVGLSGTPAEVDAAARAFRVYYAKVAQKDAPDGYLMNHSAYLYLVDDHGRFETVFAYEDNAETITAGIRKYL